MIRLVAFTFAAFALTFAACERHPLKEQTLVTHTHGSNGGDHHDDHGHAPAGDHKAAPAGDHAATPAANHTETKPAVSGSAPAAAHGEGEKVHADKK